MATIKSIKVIYTTLDEQDEYLVRAIAPTSKKVTFRDYTMNGAYNKKVTRCEYKEVTSHDIFAQCAGRWCAIDSHNGIDFTGTEYDILPKEQHEAIIRDAFARNCITFGIIEMCDAYSIAYLDGTNSNGSAINFVNTVQHLGLEEQLMVSAMLMVAEYDGEDIESYFKRSYELSMVLGALAVLDGAEDACLSVLADAFIAQQMLASSHDTDITLAVLISWQVLGIAEEILENLHTSTEEELAEAQEERVVVLQMGRAFEMPHCCVMARKYMGSGDSEMDIADLKDIAYWTAIGEAGSDLDIEAIACLTIVMGWVAEDEANEMSFAELASIGIAHVMAEEEAEQTEAETETITMVDEDGEIVEDGGVLVDEDGNIIDGEEQLAS